MSRSGHGGADGGRRDLRGGGPGGAEHARQPRRRALPRALSTGARRGEHPDQHSEGARHGDGADGLARLHHPAGCRGARRGRSEWP